MKKLAILVAGGLLSASVFAAPENQNFTGASVGVELGATKFRNFGSESKTTFDPSLKIGYAAQYGESDFVGGVEVELKPIKSDLYEVRDTDGTHLGTVQEQRRYSIGFVQGYRVTPDFMPYVKAEYRGSRIKFKTNEGVVASEDTTTFKGHGVGIGARFALSPNVEANAEYMYSRVSRNGVKLRGHSVNAGLDYRF